MAENFCIPTNFIDSKEVVSGTGRYRLVIENYKSEPENYKSEPNCGNVSKGIIYRVSDNEKLFEIHMNYSFRYNFLMKNNEEWIITGKSYTSYMFINLDQNKIVYDSYGLDAKNNPLIGFHYYHCFLSPDGNVLTVCGFVHDEPPDYRFIDFRNPAEPKKNKCMGNFNRTGSL